MQFVPYTPNQQLARRIKQKRRILRLNQAELAQMAGTSQTAISRLEVAQGNPTLDLIQRVCTALELNLTLTFKPKLEG